MLAWLSENWLNAVLIAVLLLIVGLSLVIPAILFFRKTPLRLRLRRLRRLQKMLRRQTGPKRQIQRKIGIGAGWNSCGTF